MLAKGVFAVKAKELGDGAAKPVLQEHVGILEWLSERLGESFSDRAFAAPHHSDQDDIAHTLLK